MILVVRITIGCRIIEFARIANLSFARIRSLEPGCHVPVEVVDGVRIFGVRLGEFTGEDFSLLLQPSSPQGLDGRTLRCGCCACGNTLVKRDLVPDMPPWLEVVLR